MSKKLIPVFALVAIAVGLVGCISGAPTAPPHEEELQPLSPVTDVRVYFPGDQPSLTYNGQCPTTITFVGDITVSGPCTVTYKWVRSDGAQGPVQTEVFNGPGAAQVSDTWTLGGSGWSTTQWERIDILTPEPRQSNEAVFTLNCSP